MKTAVSFLLVGLFAFAGPVESRAAPPGPLAPTAPPPGDALSGALAESPTGTIEVIVSMLLAVEPEAALTPAAVAAQHASIDAALDTLDARLAGTNSRVLDRLQSVPAALLEVDRAGLDRLRADPAVDSVTLNYELHLSLDSSTRVIDSNLLNRAGIRGDPRGRKPFEVAIIDTGVAKHHNALEGKVVYEACFSQRRDCPNRRRTQVGRGAAAPCTFSELCGHGTHVAGIAAGRTYAGGHEGVAPRARIVAIRIGNRAAGGGFELTEWDLNQALQRVLRLRRHGRPIVAVNLSLGFGAFTPRQCRQLNQLPAEQLAGQLSAARVAVVAAAGNAGRNGAIDFPACLPSVYAVSATNDSDRRARFSNVSSQTDWWAPGVNIDAPWPGGPNFEARLSGTSMSTPHVVGAFALLRECIGNRGPARVAADLSATGRRVRAAGVTRRRINVMDAASRNVPNDDFRDARRIVNGTRANVASWNVCAGVQRGEPGRNLQNSVWFRWRPAHRGRAVISTDNGGGHRTRFNTELWVYSGRRLARLHKIAYNDDGGKGTRSKVVIPVRRDTIYRIRVDGVRAQHGRFNLHVRLR